MRGPDYKQEKTVLVAEKKLSDPGAWRAGDNWRGMTFRKQR